MYHITIAQKAYSSWSMRGWLLLAAFDLAFEEELIRLYTPEFDAFQAARSPARTVPYLTWQEAGETRHLWDSLAMAETLAERHPDAGIWPAEAAHRVVARIVAAEMHSGFMALRSHCPMNFHRDGRQPKLGLEEAKADAARAGALWSWALEQTGGPWLGGPAFSAADVFMAPLATRLRDYGLMTQETEPYTMQLLAHPAVARWIAAGRADPERVALYENVP